MGKSFVLFLCLMAVSSFSKAQSFSFQVYATTGGNYTVTIDTANKRITAKSGGSNVFSYQFYDYKVEQNIIGFSFSRSSAVRMRPDHSAHYFLIRQDAIFCTTANAQQEFYFKPSNNSYSSEFNRLITALSSRNNNNNVSNNASSGSNRTFTANGVSFTMVYVAGGTFTMGATPEQGSEANNDEKPAHRVTLSSFSIGQTEVTQELWQAVMGSNPSRFKGSKRPVEEVSWNDCQDFIRKLNSITGQRFRLPTEVEWEFAARGGNSSRGYKYAGSNTLSNVAWYYDNSGLETHNVGTKSPNELGIYDMSGNVWEWCSDWYGSNYYAQSPSSNPQGPSSGSARVDRGGSWLSHARYCRVSLRSRLTPADRLSYLGLRLAL